MFKFFRRMKTVVGSELNAILDKAEDPVKMLDQFMRDMEEDIQEAEGAVAKQIANEKMLKRRANDAKVMTEKRQKQAEQAIEAENEDLARRALEDKIENEKQCDVLHESWTNAKNDSDEIREKLDEMKKEYNQMKLKKDSLKARAETAQTKTKMNRTMSTIGSDESMQGFERMEEKVLEYEAEAETTKDLSQAARTLDDEFESLEPNKVDQELAELKKKKDQK
ncbi:PspA/IM30 family protein [Virgibacillus sp. CBA3643]|uniref:PspA/IM30 family protein n=1 Tax=Virgibacillus sp. CBA3643 TaxID=2942278 RepID=UPI0035A36819